MERLHLQSTEQSKPVNYIGEAWVVQKSLRAGCTFIHLGVFRDPDCTVMLSAE